MPDHLPFCAPSYLLHDGSGGGPRLVLTLTTPDDAILLGEALAKMDPWRRLGMAAANFTGHLAESTPAKRNFLVSSDGHRAGVIVVRFPWLFGPYLNLLAILPPWQQQGIGRAALAWLEEQARQAKARNSFLCVSAFNSAAIGFYRRNGYGDAALLTDLIKDGEDEILMRKRLIDSNSL